MLLNLLIVAAFQNSKDERQFTLLFELHSVKMEKSVLSQELLQAHNSSSQFAKPVEGKEKISMANQIMVKFFDGEFNKPGSKKMHAFWLTFRATIL